MNLGLAGKRVLVGGGSRGIGLAIARAFADEDAEVAITGRTRSDLDAAKAELGEIAVIETDLRVEQQAAAAVDEAVDRLGGLDIAIANAGSGRGVVDDRPPGEAWTELLAENLLTTVNLFQAASARMTGDGALVAIGSIAGMEFHRAPLPYSAAKAALVRYVRDLARRLAPSGIRVNLVAPGNVLFDGGSWAQRLQDDERATRELIAREVPMNRFGTPQEVAASVVFLASAPSSFTTGACLVVDGGQLRA